MGLGIARLAPKHLPRRGLGLEEAAGMDEFGGGAKLVCDGLARAQLGFGGSAMYSNAFTTRWTPAVERVTSTAASPSGTVTRPMR